MKTEIINGDCLVEMPKLVARGVTVDAVIADPPYGTTACAWDAVIPFAPMWANIKQLVKRDGAIVLFGCQPFTSALVMSNPVRFKYEWIWEKSKAAGYLDARRKPLKSHENINVFCYGSLPYNPELEPGEPYINNHKPDDSGDCYGQVNAYSFINAGTRFPRTVQRFNSVPGNEQVHPTQKPVDLLRYLVRTYTNEGDTVLDFTAGSFSTGVACVIEGRNFIGIELSPDYCAVGEARIKRAQGIAVDIPRFNRREIDTPLFDAGGRGEDEASPTTPARKGFLPHPP